MGINTTFVCNLGSGEWETVSDFPSVITGVIVAEASGVNPAMVIITGETSQTGLLTLAAAAGQSAVWSGEPIAAGEGIRITCQAGDVAVTVVWR